MIQLDLLGPPEGKKVKESETKNLAASSKIRDDLDLVRIPNSTKTTKRTPLLDDLNETDKEILEIEYEIQNTLQVMGKTRKKKQAMDNDTEYASQNYLHCFKRIKTEVEDDNIDAETSENETEDAVDVLKPLGSIKDEIESDNEMYQNKISEPQNSVETLLENNSYGVKIQGNEVERAVNAIIGFEPREIVESDDDVQLIENDIEEIEINEELEIQEIDSEIREIEDEIKKNIIHKIQKGNKTSSDLVVTTDGIDIKKEKEDYNEHEESEELEIIDDIEVKEEIIDFDETVAKVFRASKNIVGVEVRDFSAIADKLNIEARPIDNSDSAIMLSTEKNCHNDTNQPSNSGDLSSDQTQSQLNSRFRRRKLFRCKNCAFKGYYRKYLLHIHELCPRRIQNRNDKSEKIKINGKWGPRYHCSKCGITYLSTKTYMQHFSYRHKLPKLACPQCMRTFKRLSNLSTHVMLHIRDSFVEKQSFNDKSDFITPQRERLYRCIYVNCTELVKFKDFFKHWDLHLDLVTVNIKKDSEKSPEEETELILKELTMASEIQPSNSGDQSSDDTQSDHMMKIIEGIARKKVYQCNKCSFQGHHREFKIHIAKICPRKPHNRNKPKRKIEKINEKWGPHYHCTKCNETFITSKAYVEHFDEHSLPQLTCPQCKMSFPNIPYLTEHLMMHVKDSFVKMQIINEKSDFVTSKRDGVFQCNTCSEVVIYEDFFRHWETHLNLFAVKKENMQSDSEESPKEQAELSPKELKAVLACLVKSKTDDPSSLNTSKICVLCQRQFERRNDGKRHLIEHLLLDSFANKSKYGSFMCQVCGEHFPKGFQYKEHMRQHASLPLYKCQLCNKSFSDSSNFTKHKKIHNLKVLICDICKKKFQSKRSIERHMMMHRTTKPIQCPKCDRVFYASGQFNKHHRTHFKTVYPPRYNCVLCKVQFNSLKNKWDHMWEVHKERKFAADCPFCPESYRKFADVKRHVKEEHWVSIQKSYNKTMTVSNDIPLI